MEIEFKFLVPAARRAAVTAALEGAGSQRTRLQAFYFDTPGRSLAAARIVLRVRKEGETWVQTVKAQGDGLLQRLEHNVTREAGPDPDRPPAPDLRLHHGSDVWRVLERALPSRRGETPVLVGIYGTDIVRLSRTVAVGASRVELALDQGRVMAPLPDGSGELSSPVSELELELVGGRVDDLAALALTWRRRHGLWVSTLSKAWRGERVAAAASRAGAQSASAADPAAVARPVKARAPVFPEGSGAPLTGRDIQRLVVDACLAQVLPNAGEVAAGSTDPEVVHQLRVGLRRLRTALRALDGLAPSPFDPAWAAPLATAFRTLGLHRDRHVLQRQVLPRLREAGAPPAAVLALPPLPARTATVQAVVRNAAFQDTLVALLAFTAPAAHDGGNEGNEGNAGNAGNAGNEGKERNEGGEAAREGNAKGRRDDASADPLHRIAQRLGKLHRQVVRGARDFEAMPAEARHRLRKRLKRLRYLTGFTGPLFGAKAAARYAKRLEPAQDALGALMDEQVALQSFTDAAQAHPEAWFAVGWFTARQGDGVKACEAALQGIGKARKFWNKAG